MFGGGGFNPAKLKPQLKMAVGRIEILKNKKTALLKQSKREVAILLSEQPPKEEKARIRAEALIRDDHLIEALEIIQLELELLHERIKLLEYSKECPPDMVSVVSTVMWASHRVDVNELLLIRQQFKAKFGKKFEENAMRNVGGVLNERVVTKLSIEPPAAYLVHTYLEKICEEYEVSWTSSIQLTSADMVVPMQAPTGYSVPIAQGTGLGSKLLPPHTGMPTLTQHHPHLQPTSITQLPNQFTPFVPPGSINHDNNLNNLNNPNHDSKGSGGIPTVVTAIPYYPSNNAHDFNGTNRNDDNFGAMCNSPYSTITSTTTTFPPTTGPTTASHRQQQLQQFKGLHPTGGIGGSVVVGDIPISTISSSTPTTTTIPPTKTMPNDEEPEIYLPTNSFHHTEKSSIDQRQQMHHPENTYNKSNSGSYSDLAARFNQLNKK